MAARLRDYAVARVHQDDGQIGGGCAGGHVARVLLVTRRVGDDELALGRGEITISDIDSDALFALGSKAIGEQRKIDRARGLVDGRATNGSQLIFVDALGIVQQAPDEGGFAVVHAARRS